MLVIEASREPAGLRLRGELDIAGADELNRALDPRIHRGGQLNLDLSEITFLDSTGIAVVIRAAVALEGRGRLVLHGARPAIRRVLDIAGVERIPNVELRE